MCELFGHFMGNILGTASTLSKQENAQLKSMTDTYTSSLNTTQWSPKQKQIYSTDTPHNY
jgi:hypothetical protein